MQRPQASSGANSARDHFPDRMSLPALREASQGCQACHLWKIGTQTVFGEGQRAARLMLVGEQPGDEEDKRGRPFVGPAGRLLDQALASAGIDRGDVYLTNVVKHFKWEPQGKRRLHKKPAGHEIRACIPWLHKEIEMVKPEVLVCLGATAAQALLGASFRVSKQRGVSVASPLASHVLATVHPSSILRARSSEERASQLQQFIDDLRAAAARLGPAGDGTGEDIEP
jgi:uracil-DNA glycosylase